MRLTHECFMIIGKFYAWCVASQAFKPASVEHFSSPETVVAAPE